MPSARLPNSTGSMPMNTFDYVRPATTAEAVAAAAQPVPPFWPAHQPADLMKGGHARPGRLVDVNYLPELGRHRASPGGVRIERSVRNADLAHDPSLRGAFPAVAEALLSRRLAQLRNAATSAHLLQRTRCAYFYRRRERLQQTRSQAPAARRGGDTRLHAVLGGARAASRRIVRFLRPLQHSTRGRDRGQSRTPRDSARDFHRLPYDTPERESVLEPGDLIVAVRLPDNAAAFSAQPATSRFASHSYAFAVCRPPPPCGRSDTIMQRGSRSAASLRSRAGPCAEASVAGASRNGAAFRGRRAALADAKAVSDNAFRIELARRIVVHALTLAAAGTPQRVPTSSLPFADNPGVQLHA